MLKDVLPELKQWASDVGADWGDVLKLKAELIEQERCERYDTDGVRQTAWQAYCHRNSTAGCHGFWRCGFDHVRRRLNKKDTDFASIRGYDTIAEVVRTEFPQWRERSTEDLFDWLLNTPYEPWPPRQEFYERAIARIEAEQGSNVNATADCGAVPF